MNFWLSERSWGCIGKSTLGSTSVFGIDSEPLSEPTPEPQPEPGSGFDALPPLETLETLELLKRDPSR